MTARDKTEDKLLSSIRKNRPVADKPAQQPPAKKAAPRKAPTTRAKPKVEAAAAAEPCYQSGRRVWPD